MGRGDRLALGEKLGDKVGERRCDEGVGESEGLSDRLLRDGDKSGGDKPRPAGAGSVIVSGGRLGDVSAAMCLVGDTEEDRPKEKVASRDRSAAVRRIGLPSTTLWLPASCERATELAWVWGERPGSVPL